MNTDTLLRSAGTPATLEENRDNGFTSHEDYNLEHVKADTFQVGKFKFTATEVTGSRISKNHCFLQVLPYPS